MTCLRFAYSQFLQAAVLHNVCLQKQKQGVHAKNHAAACEIFAAPFKARQGKAILFI